MRKFLTPGGNNSPFTPGHRVFPWVPEGKKCVPDGKKCVLDGKECVAKTEEIADQDLKQEIANSANALIFGNMEKMTFK